MATQTSSKFAAFGLALLTNGIILGGIAYLFDAAFLHQVRAVVTAVA